MRRILLILLLGVIMMSLVSSDTKTYDSKIKEVKIKDISNNELASFVLLYNTEHCGGDQMCYAIIEANLKQSKQDVFSKLKFNKIKGKGDITNLKIEYTNSSGDWVTYNSDLNYNGKFKIKISGYKLSEDSVDWIPTLYNLDINEWAVWGEQLTYDDFNDGIINWSLWRNDSATNGQQTETGGKFKVYVASDLCSGCSMGNTVYSTNLSGLNAIENITVSIKLHARSNSCCSSANLNFGGTGLLVITSSSSTVENDSIWTIIRNQTSAGKFETYANGNWIAQITPSTNIFSFGASTDNQAGDNAYAEVDYVYYTIYNGSLIITLNTPLDDSNQFSLTSNNMVFNITSNATVNNLKNITLYLDDVSNGTQTISGTINNTIITRDFSSLSLGEHNWSVYVCDDASNCKFSDLRQFIIVPFKENSQTYNATTLESSSESFTLNMTYNSSYYTVVSATLIYNGTSYLGTPVGSGDTILFTRGINVPLVNAPTAKNFYWNISLTNSTGSTVYAITTINNQTIYPIILAYCNATYTATTLNFTIYEEATFLLLNASFEMSLDYWIDGGSEALSSTFNFQNLTQNQSNYKFCLGSNTSIFRVTGVASYAKTGYDNREYFFINALINNATQNIPLYLATTSGTDIQTVTILDEGNNPVNGALVRIERWDIGTGNFYTINMFTTDNNGQGIANLFFNSAWYRYVVIKNGITYLTTDPAKETSTTKTLRVYLSQPSPYLKFNNISYNFLYYDDTSVFSFIYDDTSGLVATGCLRISKLYANTTTQVYYSCVYSTSGTLSYTLNENGTYLGEAEFQLNNAYGNIKKTVSSILANKGVPERFLVMGKLGYVASLLLIGTMGLVGVASGSIFLGGVLVVIAAVFCDFLGWLNIPTSVLFSLIAIMILVLVGLKRRYA